MYKKITSFARYISLYIILLTCFKIHFAESYLWAQILVAILLASLATEGD